MSSIFDYGAAETGENGDEPEPEHVTRVCDNGDANYTSYRMTIPKDVAEERGLSPGDHLEVEATEDGFKVTALDI